jgi:hypothetical protein
MNNALKQFGLLLLALCLFCSAAAAETGSDSWVCMNCGQDASGSNCPVCGEPQGEWICMGCGTRNLSSACMNCGKQQRASLGLQAADPKPLTAFPAVRVLAADGEVSALFALCWNAVKVLTAGEGLRKYTHASVSRVIPGACRVLSVFALFGLIASVSHLLRFGPGAQPVKSVAYPVLKVLAAALAERCGRFFRALEWGKA